MIWALTVLLLYQLVGEVLVRMLNLALPGPVLGMLLLFFSLLLKKSVAESLQQTSNSLVLHLSLLFVPAGVGIVRHLALLQSQGVALLLTLILSTLLTMLVTAWVIGFLSRKLST